ncbi:MAG: hypothetical protein FD172_1277 [Methylocystaceae bacterium]|nr:MAG: hypothetical protein FD172_1277 [Methylocystaceae bacterium]
MTAFHTLDDVDVKGKRVLLRVDLNVPMEDGRVTDATRIERALPTINEIVEKGGRVILLSHFGRPKGQRVDAESLRQVVPTLEHFLKRKIAFADDCVGDAAAKIVEGLKDGDVALLENTRFHKGEEKNAADFIDALARNGDIFVSDAFSAAHRAHASTEGIAHRLPAYAGRAISAAAGHGDRRRRESVDEARTSGQSRREGRISRHRRRDGEHLPCGARQACRQIAVRT